MIFRRAKEETAPEERGADTSAENRLIVVVPTGAPGADQLISTLSAAHTELSVQSAPSSAVTTTGLVGVQGGFAGMQACLAVFQDNRTLDLLLTHIVAARNARKDGFPVLVIATELHRLAMLGSWLHQHAEIGDLQGIRLIAVSTLLEIPSKLAPLLDPVKEPNVIKMPVSTEVDCKEFKYFYTISPQFRRIVHTIRELAENNIRRVYILGGPGVGKTSLAYYYWLCRGKGQFVSVNLNAESTGNKESMKSLLCGHVTGAYPGAASREGVLSFAGEGVAFLDESHGVTGVVMQVLMEVLDSGQYLPFGATKKRALEAAVIFASNRSWEALRDMMHLDEHARLGATIISLTDLSVREEDMIAVLATTLARFGKQCTTWKPPLGVTPESWSSLRACPWRGNTRSFIRVLEAAAIANASSGSSSDVIPAHYIDEALTLWEPAEHHSMQMYTSFKE